MKTQLSFVAVSLILLTACSAPSTAPAPPNFIVNDLEDPACLVQISAEDGSLDEKIVSVENPLAPGESAQIRLPVGLHVQVRVEGCAEDFLHVFEMEIPPEGFSYHLGAQ